MKYLVNNRAVLGHFVHEKGGWVFAPHDRARQRGRKVHAEPGFAIPDWAKAPAGAKSYIIDAEDESAAFFSVSKYALRATEEVRPDVAPPSSSTALAKGFWPNSYSMRVDPACTSAVYHAIGRDDQTTTQQPRHLFSTRLLALRAMRNEVEREAARKLASIDALISDETTKEAS